MYGLSVPRPQVGRHLVNGDIVDSCFDVTQENGGQDKQSHVSCDSYTQQL